MQVSARRLLGQLKIVLPFIRRQQGFVQHTSLHFGWYWQTQQSQNRGRDVEVVTFRDPFTRRNAGAVEQHHARGITTPGFDLSGVVNQISIPEGLAAFRRWEVATGVFGSLVVVAQVYG